MLTNGVRKFLGTREGVLDPAVFGGVAATGIAAEVGNEAVVKGNVMEATKRLVEGGDVSVVILDVAILVGLEQSARESCVEVLGEEKGKMVRIVGQMLAGVTTLDGLARVAAAFDY